MLNLAEVLKIVDVLNEAFPPPTDNSCELVFTKEVASGVMVNVWNNGHIARFQVDEISEVYDVKTLITDIKFLIANEDKSNETSF